MPEKTQHQDQSQNHHSMTTTMNNNNNSSSSRRKKQTFPRKLFALLENAETFGYSNIISWHPNGESFQVWEPERFEQEIMPAYFKQSKFKSFLRQLNTYHFQRITSGVNRGGYAHPCFLRHRGPESACEDVKRLSPDGESHSSTTCDDSHSNSRSYDSAPPRFFGTKSFFDIRDTTTASTPLPRLLLPAPIRLEEQARIKSGEITSNDLDIFANLFDNGPADQDKAEQESSKVATTTTTTATTPKAMEVAAKTLLSQPSHKGGLSEIEPIPVVKSSSLASSSTAAATTASSSTPEAAAAAAASTTTPMPPPPSLPHVLMMPSSSTTTTCAAATVRMIPPLPLPSPIQNSDLHRNENTFPLKVYRMLQDVETNGKNHIVSWINDGTAFQVHDQDAFVREILPLYFDQSLYESFRRQLNMYSFTRITRGPMKGTCYHKDFLRCDPFRLHKITRRKRKNKSNIHNKTTTRPTSRVVSSITN